MTDLQETFADVTALIPRYSWEIMDEEQRDELMAKVVLPRYMKTTSDGVQLGPTAWAEMVGATARAIESRVYRLRQQASRNEGELEHARRLDDARRHRATRQTLREADPKQVREIVRSLPPYALNELTAATHEAQTERIRDRAVATTLTISNEDEGALADRFASIHDRSILTMQECFVSLSKVRVFGAEKLVENANAKERREWSERLPDDIAVLQLVLDLCKTARLRPVKEEVG